MMRTHDNPSFRRRGFSLLEVLIGLAILLAGLLGVMAVFPYTLRSQREAEALSLAAPLAQMKAEEIRRDDDRTGRLVREIKRLEQPTPPIVFPNEPRLTYSFSGRSLLYPNAGGDPRGLPNVARVIVRYAPDYRPSQDVLYELRFD